MKTALPLLALLLLPLAHAEQRTVTLAVERMNCAACPYIIEQTLRGVAGVESAEVDYQTRRARVVYDDTRVRVSDLTAATARLGFPSHTVE